MQTFKEFLLQERAERLQMIGPIPVIKIDGRFSAEKLINTKEVGSGIQAKAFEHPKNINGIIKIVEIYSQLPEDDAQVKATKLFMEHQDNPFFPKIYSAKIYTSQQLPFHMIVSMEKLRPLRRTNLKHLLPQLLDSIGVDAKNLNREWIENTNSIGSAYALASLFKNPELAKKSTNPKFKEAIDLLHSVKIPNDLHQDNIMLRLTSVGPQLVLLDPYVQA